MLVIIKFHSLRQKLPVLYDYFAFLKFMFDIFDSIIRYIWKFIAFWRQHSMEYEITVSEKTAFMCECFELRSLYAQSRPYSLDFNILKHACNL